MNTIIVKMQAELDAALKAGRVPNIIEGSLTLELRGTTAPSIIISGKAELCLTALESSQPRVVARESSQPSVEAWESSQPRVEAYGWVQLAVLGAVTVKAAAMVAVLIEGKDGKVTGGNITRRPPVRTAEDWCAYYGAPVFRGVAILFKGVDAEYRANYNGFRYVPGTIPEAPDWDGGLTECGGGLHFSPTPRMALAYNRQTVRFVACPVALKDIVVHENASYPDKVKARACCAPVYEVDEDGEKVAAGPLSSQGEKGEKTA